MGNNTDNNIKYTDIKRHFYNSINTTIKEVEASYGKENLEYLLKQYQAQDLRELVNIMFCASDTTNNKLNINLQNHIQEMEKELYRGEWDYSFLVKKNKDLESQQGLLIDEIKGLKNLSFIYTQKTKELEQFYYDFNLILLSNNLDLKTEMNKIKKYTPPPSSPSQNNNNLPKI